MSQPAHSPYVSDTMLMAGARAMYAACGAKMNAAELRFPAIALLSAIPAVYRAMHAARGAVSLDPTAAERQRRHRQKLARKS